MPIDNPNPLTVPQTAQKVYDKVWIVSVVIEAPNPVQKVRASIRVRNARADANLPAGIEVYSEADDSADTIVRVEDVFALVASRPATAGALEVALYGLAEDLLKNLPTEAERGIVSVTVNRPGQASQVYPPPLSGVEDVARGQTTGPAQQHASGSSQPNQRTGRSGTAKASGGKQPRS